MGSQMKRVSGLVRDHKHMTSKKRGEGGLAKIKTFLDGGGRGCTPKSDVRIYFFSVANFKKFVQVTNDLCIEREFLLIILIHLVNFAVYI